MNEPDHDNQPESADQARGLPVTAEPGIETIQRQAALVLGVSSPLACEPNSPEPGRAERESCDGPAVDAPEPRAEVAQDVDGGLPVEVQKLQTCEVRPDGPAAVEAPPLSGGPSPVEKAEPPGGGAAPEAPKVEPGVPSGPAPEEPTARAGGQKRWKAVELDVRIQGRVLGGENVLAKAQMAMGHDLIEFRDAKGYLLLDVPAACFEEYLGRHPVYGPTKLRQCIKMAELSDVVTPLIEDGADSSTIVAYIVAGKTNEVVTRLLAETWDDRPKGARALQAFLRAHLEEDQGPAAAGPTRQQALRRLDRLVGQLPRLLSVVCYHDRRDVLQRLTEALTAADVSEITT